MNNQRYKVDERVGCAAIIDTFYPNDSNGLDSDHPSTIKYINLSQPEYPTHQKTSEMLAYERQTQLYQLQETCDEMNANNKHSKYECQIVLAEFDKAGENMKRVFPKLFKISVW